MKAIESKRETEKKQKRNQWIIGGILIIVMLGSTFGYAFYHFGDKAIKLGKKLGKLINSFGSLSNFNLVISSSNEI